MEGSALLLITSQNLAGIYVGSTSQLGEFCYEDFWEQFMVSLEGRVSIKLKVQGWCVTFEIDATQVQFPGPL